jgi:disulfide bond formation protein DsbB
MTKLLPNLSRPQVALGISLMVSALLLLGAHGFERIGGMAPCLLCLDQREAHWAILAAGGMALALRYGLGSGVRVLAAALGVLSLLYLVGGGLAGYHAGVEWGFWPGPEACAPDLREGLPAADELFASLQAGAPPPSCSEAAWRMMGISMAGYNAIISFALAGLTMLSCYRAAWGLREDRVGPGVPAE